MMSLNQVVLVLPLVLVVLVLVNPVLFSVLTELVWYVVLVVALVSVSETDVTGTCLSSDSESLRLLPEPDDRDLGRG